MSGKPMAFISCQFKALCSSRLLTIPTILRLASIAPFPLGHTWVELRWLPWWSLWCELQLGKSLFSVLSPGKLGSQVEALVPLLGQTSLWEDHVELSCRQPLLLSTMFPCTPATPRSPSSRLLLEPRTTEWISFLHWRRSCNSHPSCWLYICGVFHFCSDSVRIVLVSHRQAHGGHFQSAGGLPSPPGRASMHENTLMIKSETWSQILPVLHTGHVITWCRYRGSWDPATPLVFMWLWHLAHLFVWPQVAIKSIEDVVPTDLPINMYLTQHNPPTTCKVNKTTFSNVRTLSAWLIWNLLLHFTRFTSCWEPTMMCFQCACPVWRGQFYTQHRGYFFYATNHIK